MTVAECETAWAGRVVSEMKPSPSGQKMLAGLTKALQVIAEERAPPSIMYTPFLAFITNADIDDAKIESLRIYEQSGSKIDAIKYVRSRLCCGLKEAKDFFETQVETAEVKAASVLRDAAPDLLAALKETVLQIEYMHAKFMPTGSGERVLARARAAIAKATP